MIIDSAGGAAALLAPLFSSTEQEKLAVLHLDGRQRLLSLREHRLGGRAEVGLPIRTIVEAAIELGSQALVIAHNHPSGDPDPSEADRESTRRLEETLANLGMRLHDHLIFAEGRIASFRELGLLR